MSTGITLHNVKTIEVKRCSSTFAQWFEVVFTDKNGESVELHAFFKDEPVIEGAEFFDEAVA